jgi:hypothetical protein
MPKILLDINDRLLELAAKHLRTDSPQDTVEAALLAVTGPNPPTPPSEPPSFAEDAADIADADAAMQEAGESVTLEQAETELDRLDALSSDLTESRRAASERLLGELRNGMLADLADAEIMTRAQR